MAIEFEIVKTRGEQKWHARIRSAGNREILFWTEDYEHKRDARHACELIQAGAAAATIPQQSTKVYGSSPVVVR